MEFVPPFLEVNEAFRVAEVLEYPKHSACLGEYGGKGCSSHAPVEVEDKEGGDDDIGSYGEQGGEHCFFGVTGGPHDIVEPDENEGNGGPQQQYLHEVTSVRECLGTGSEEVEYGVEENECDEPEAYGIDNAEEYDIMEYISGSFCISLPEIDGTYSGSTDGYQCTEGDDKVHQWEGDSQPRDAEGTYTVTDKDTVDDVVQRSYSHTDDCRNGVLY